MSTDEIILGIDLGTTFSVAAYVDERGRPKVIPNAEGEKTTPSAVLIENGQVQVGAVALNQAIVKRDNVIRWIKRSMGELDYRFQGLGPIEISAEILKKIKADSEAELGIPLRKAVITCPAYFSAIEVESTMKAGLAAGFEVQEIVREPTAAAVYYGVEHLQDSDKLLVCDLGGGTYDASILTLEGDTFKPLATAGDRRLGGHDWTSDLLEHVIELLLDTFDEDPRSDPAAVQILYDTCERMKRAFAQSDQGVIPCVFQGQTAQVTVSRSDFERMTEWRIQQMLTWTEKALEKATPPLTWDQIDHILLVGGATRMRRVPEALEELSGKKPIQTAEADTMVALGAAVLAKGAFRPRRKVASSGIKKSVVSGLTLINFTRTAPRNLGTKVIARDDGHFHVRNSLIIPYGTETPAEKTRADYRTSVVGQPFFDIPVVEFDDVGPEVIQETWRFECPPGLPQSTPIHVTFRYDRSGRIDVEAVEQHGQTQLTKQKVPYEEPDLEAIRCMAPPRDVVFALDVSGSMRAYNKIERAKQAVVGNARDLIDAGAGQVRVGIVAFGSQAKTICLLTSDLQKITAAVSDVRPFGTTAMGAGINLALDMLSKSDTGGVQEIVLVSDGMPDKPAEAMAAGARAQAQGANLCLIGVGHQEVNEAFLKDMSSNYLVIESAEGISDAIHHFLTEATPVPIPQAGITWLKPS
jgi:molecular chaperone DnaK